MYVMDQIAKYEAWLRAVDNCARVSMCVLGTNPTSKQDIKRYNRVMRSYQEGI